MPTDDQSIPDDLPIRLDAVRERLDVEVRRVPRGSPQCHGRDFDVWRVSVGPYGWRDSPPPGHDVRRRTHPDPHPREMIGEGPSLAAILAQILDEAERKWPV